MQWDNIQKQIDLLKEQQDKLAEKNIYLRATKEQEE
jgi:hypothetical protein